MIGGIVRVISLIAATLFGILAIVMSIIVIAADFSPGALVVALGSWLAFGVLVFFMRKQKPLDTPAKLQAAEQQKEQLLVEKFNGMLDRKHSFASYGIAAVLVAISGFLYLTGRISFDPTAEELYKVGGGYGHDTAHGQFWRLFTPMFLHGSFYHLLANVVGLVTVGRLLDYIVGWRNLLIIFFLGGVAGSAASAFANPGIVSIGASGAIFAIYGAIGAGYLFSQRLRDVSVPKSVFYGAGYQALQSLSYGFSKAGIDNAAHLGGLVAGFVILSVWYLEKNSVRHRAMTYVGSFAFIVGVSAFAMPKFIAKMDMNPITLASHHKEVLASIVEIETLEQEYSQLFKKDLTAEAKASYLSRFHLKYEQALAHLVEIGAKDGLGRRIIVGRQAFLDRAQACLPYYRLVGRTVRSPASLQDVMRSGEYSGLEETCLESTKKRTALLESISATR